MPSRIRGPRALTLRECSVTDRRVDLLVIQLKAAIRRILETKGVRARVLDKVNRYGEVVIGVILERPAPAPRGVLAPEGGEDVAVHSADGAHDASREATREPDRSGSISDAQRAVTRR
jgi:hypothetical protein